MPIQGGPGSSRAGTTHTTQSGRTYTYKAGPSSGGGGTAGTTTTTTTKKPSPTVVPSGRTTATGETIWKAAPTPIPGIAGSKVKTTTFHGGGKATILYESGAKQQTLSTDRGTRTTSFTTSRGEVLTGSSQSIKSQAAVYESAYKVERDRERELLKTPEGRARLAEKPPVQIYGSEKFIKKQETLRPAIQKIRAAERRQAPSLITIGPKEEAPKAQQPPSSVLAEFERMKKEQPGKMQYVIPSDKGEWTFTVPARSTMDIAGKPPPPGKRYPPTYREYLKQKEREKYGVRAERVQDVEAQLQALKTKVIGTSFEPLGRVAVGALGIPVSLYRAAQLPGQTAKDIYQAVTHPAETLHAIGEHIREEPAEFIGEMAGWYGVSKLTGWGLKKLPVRVKPGLPTRVLIKGPDPSIFEWTVKGKPLLRVLTSPGKLTKLKTAPVVVPSGTSLIPYKSPLPSPSTVTGIVTAPTLLQRVITKVRPPPPKLVQPFKWLGPEPKPLLKAKELYPKKLSPSEQKILGELMSKDYIQTSTETIDIPTRMLTPEISKRVRKQYRKKIAPKEITPSLPEKISMDIAKMKEEWYSPEDVKAFRQLTPTKYYKPEEGILLETKSVIKARKKTQKIFARRESYTQTIKDILSGERKLAPGIRPTIRKAVRQKYMAGRTAEIKRIIEGKLMRTEPDRGLKAWQKRMRLQPKVKELTTEYLKTKTPFDIEMFPLEPWQVIIKSPEKLIKSPKKPTKQFGWLKEELKGKPKMFKIKPPAPLTKGEKEIVGPTGQVLILKPQETKVKVKKKIKLSEPRMIYETKAKAKLGEPKMKYVSQAKSEYAPLRYEYYEEYLWLPSAKPFERTVASYKQRMTSLASKVKPIQVRKSIYSTKVIPITVSQGLIAIQSQAQVQSQAQAQASLQAQAQVQSQEQAQESTQRSIQTQIQKQELAKRTIQELKLDFKVPKIFVPKLKRRRRESKRRKKERKKKPYKRTYAHSLWGLEIAGKFKLPKIPRGFVGTGISVRPVAKLK